MKFSAMLESQPGAGTQIAVRGPMQRSKRNNPAGVAKKVKNIKNERTTESK
jgi:hypothetical protein